MTTKYKIGIIGVGGMGIANYHTKEFLKDERAEITACCDIEREVLDEFSQKHNIVHTYLDYEKMLADSDLDIVLICTNETLHKEMTVKAASFKPQAIFCEKPIAMDLGEADEMLEACNQNDVLLIVGHQRRYYQQYYQTRELLKDGVIGELQQIHAYGHPGSSLMVDGTHTMDLIRFFLDDEPAKWVFGQIDLRTGRKNWGHILEDGLMALIRFESGVRAFYTAGGMEITPDKESIGTGKSFRHFVEPEDAEASYHHFTLLGTKGKIVINGDFFDENNNTPLLQVIKGEQVENIIEDSYDINERWYNDLSPQKDLLDVLENGHQHLLEGESARANHEILMAIYESAYHNRLVTLPFAKKENPLNPMLEEKGFEI